MRLRDLPMRLLDFALLHLPFGMAGNAVVYPIESSPHWCVEWTGRSKREEWAFELWAGWLYLVVDQPSRPMPLSQRASRT